MLALFIFLGGAAIGSFLNVVIVRFPASSALRGRSACPHCHTSLRWWELIPLISYSVLSGRCRSCHAPLTVQYPLVEFIVGCLALIFFIPLPSSPQLMSEALIAFGISCMLLVLFVIDVRTFLLPDKYVVLATILVIALLLVPQRSVRAALSGAAIGAGFLFILWLVTKRRGIGLGDIKLAVPLGLLLGPAGTIAMLLAAFISGGIYGVYLLASQRATLKSPVPFGPFMIGATALVILFPQLADFISSAAL